MRRGEIRHLEREKALATEIELVAGIDGEHLYTWAREWCARSTKASSPLSAHIVGCAADARERGTNTSVPDGVRETIERAVELATDPRTIARRRLFQDAHKRVGRSVIVGGVRVDARFVVHAAATAQMHGDERVAAVAVTLDTTSAAGLGSARCLVLSGREWVMVIAPIVSAAGEVADA